MTDPDNDPPDCEECGESEGHDPDCSEYVREADFETEAEWLDRRLGW